MTTLDFPSSPSTGQTYTANGVTYTFDGLTWRGSTPANGYGPVLLSEKVLTTTSASETISLPSSGYRDIKIIVRGRGDTAATTTQLRIRFNGDTGSNYDSMYIAGLNGAVSSSTANGTSINGGDFPAATASANFLATCELIVYDYIGTTFYKGGVGLANARWGTTTATADLLELGYTWRSTSAISSVTVFPSAGNFISGTIISIYGIPNVISNFVPASFIPPLTVLQRTTTQAVSNVTVTNVSWDTTVIIDNVGAFSSGTPTRITVPSLYTKVRLSWGITWASNSTGGRWLILQKNGSEIERRVIQGFGESGMELNTRWLTVAASDYFEFFVYQSSGGSLNITPAGPSVYVEAMWSPG